MVSVLERLEQLLLERDLQIKVVPRPDTLAHSAILLATFKIVLEDPVALRA